MKKIILLLIIFFSFGIFQSFASITYDGRTYPTAVGESGYTFYEYDGIQLFPNVSQGLSSIVQYGFTPKFIYKSSRFSFLVVQGYPFPCWYSNSYNGTCNMHLFVHDNLLGRYYAIGSSSQVFISIQDGYLIWKNEQYGTAYIFDPDTVLNHMANGDLYGWGNTDYAVVYSGIGFTSYNQSTNPYFYSDASIVIPPDKDCITSKDGNTLRCNGFYDSTNQNLDISIYNTSGTKVFSQTLNYEGGTLYMPVPAAPNTPYYFTLDIPSSLSPGDYTWKITDEQNNIRGTYNFNVPVIIPPDKDCITSKNGNTLRCNGFYDSTNQNLDISIYNTSGSKVFSQTLNYEGGTLYMPAPAVPNTPYYFTLDIPSSLSPGDYTWKITDEQNNIRGTYNFNVFSDSSGQTLFTSTIPDDPDINSFIPGNFDTSIPTSVDEVKGKSDSITSVIVSYLTFFIRPLSLTPSTNIDVPVPYITPQFKLGLHIYSAELPTITDTLNVSSVQRNDTGAKALTFFLSLVFLISRAILFSILLFIFYIFWKFVELPINFIIPNLSQKSTSSTNGNVITFIVEIIFLGVILVLFAGIFAYEFPLLKILYYADNYLISLFSFFALSLGEYSLFVFVVDTVLGGIIASVLGLITYRLALKYFHTPLTS